MCRQIEIKTQKATLLAVELPEDTTSIRKGVMDEFFYDTKFGYEGMDVVNLPDGNWQHIGTLDQMTEEVWKGIVDEVEPFESGAYLNYYKQVEWDRNFYPYAIKSGLSLLKANGVLFENPLGEKPDKEDYIFEEHPELVGNPKEYDLELFEKDIYEWEKLQEKVLNRNRTHFFINQ